MVVLERWRLIAERALLLALLAPGGCVSRGDIVPLPSRPPATMPPPPASLPVDAAEPAGPDAALEPPDASAPPPDAPPPPDGQPLPPVTDPTAPPATQPAPPPAADLSAQLALFLTLDEGTGKVVHDDSGFQLRVSLVDGDPVSSWVEGRFGKALALSGGNKGGYLQVENDPSLIDARIEWSFSAWLLLPPGASGTLLARRNAGTGGYLYVVKLAKGRVTATINAGNAYSGTVTSPVEVPVARWVHVAMTFDSVNLKLFVDGQLADTVEYRLSVPPSLTPITIGGAEVETPAHDAVAGVQDRLPARLDDVLLYNRVLADSDVDRLSQGIRPVPVPPQPPPTQP